MENKEKKSISYYMRVWHRYAGFFIAGFVILWACSGIVLIYRDTDFLKHEKTTHVNLAADINPAELGSALRIRDFRVIKTEGNILIFQGGTFNKSTGVAEVTVKELLFPFNKLSGLHKTASKSGIHWFSLTFGIIMLFMAVSSFWMFKGGSEVLRNGILTATAGIIFAIILLLFVK